MKTIKLNPTEYITNFKKIANFAYKASVIHGIVHITAKIEYLKELGY